MEFDIVGVQKKEFKADNGQMICGYQLHVTSKNKYTDGVAVDKFFATDSKVGAYKPLPGDHVNIMFNRYGKVDTVDLM